MKKIYLLLLISFFSYQIQAQPDEKEDKPAFHPSVAVKWNPASIYFGKIGLFGEFNFKHRKSVTLAVGIPTNKTLTYELDDEDESISMKTFSIMGSYRMYLGKKDMSGFYFEPYVKYLKNDATTTINSDLNGTPTDYATTSTYKGVGVGLQLGVQFLIANRVVIDMFFLGPEANSSRHQVVMHDITSSGPWDAQETQEAEQEIEDSIGDLPIIGDKLEVVVDPNARTVSSDFKGFLPGFRAGLSIGVRF